MLQDMYIHTDTSAGINLLEVVQQQSSTWSRKMQIAIFVCIFLQFTVTVYGKNKEFL